jgi:hypothetical protein
MKIFAILLFVLITTVVFAQEIIVDLSSDKPTIPNRINNGATKLILSNCIPKKVYEISTVIKNKTNLPQAFRLAPNSTTNSNKSESLDDTNVCKDGDKIKDQLSELRRGNFDSEYDLKVAIDKLKKSIDILPKLCKEDANERLKKIESEELSKYHIISELKDCQEVFIKIQRKGKKEDTQPEKTWEIILTTDCPENDKWLIHYGFTYQPNLISKYDQYFSKQFARTDSFYVAKMNTDQSKFWENLSPTIMFTYPLTIKEKTWKMGVSGIAATNFSTFSAGTGFSVIFGYNLALGTGIMFTQKNVLKGEYKEGDVLRSSLSFDQLHSKKWGPEIYFTIGLRFDKNPFTGNTEKKETEKKEADKKD